MRWCFLRSDSQNPSHWTIYDLTQAKTMMKICVLLKKSLKSLRYFKIKRVALSIHTGSIIKTGTPTFFIRLWALRFYSALHGQSKGSKVSSIVITSVWRKTQIKSTTLLMIEINTILITITKTTFLNATMMFYFSNHQDVTHRCPNCTAIVGRYKAKMWTKKNNIKINRKETKLYHLNHTNKSKTNARQDSPPQ